jgi:predicted DNA-binding transcriptional regulator AlpA
MASHVCATFFCPYCQKETKFLHVHSAAIMSAVSRRTIYDWMDHGWIHWREMPSGRKLICEESLGHHVNPGKRPPLV